MMKSYIIKRILYLFPILFLISILAFAMSYYSPSDPVRAKYSRMGVSVDETVIEKERESLGLNDSFFVRYGRWLKGVLHGDLGESYTYDSDVTKEFARRIPRTMQLAGASMLLMIIISFPFGILSAVYQNKWIDYLLRFYSFVGISMPSFWVGTLLMYLFGVKLKVLPVVGSGDLKHLILPSLSLAFWLSSIYIRRLRGSMLEELNQDYVKGCVSRGVSVRRAILCHVVPNSLISIVTMLGMSIGNLFGGATIVETIFEWNGVGKMAVDAVSYRDYPVIQGYVLWMAFIYVLVNLLVDISYQFLDPRIRLGEKK